eukprot:4892309-Pyramimonas_sp.AAC.1
MAADTRTSRNVPAAGVVSSSILACRVSVCCHATGSRDCALPTAAVLPLGELVALHGGGIAVLASMPASKCSRPSPPGPLLS